MFRTRFREQIVAEFLPAKRERKTQKLIILCDGMPSIPRKQSLSEFLAATGFWVIYPRYRGTWESGGEFLKQSPHEDILDIIADLPRSLRRLPSVSVFDSHRSKSSSSEEASVERRLCLHPSTQRSAG
jgi:hypothetical protein